MDGTGRAERPQSGCGGEDPPRRRKVLADPDIAQRYATFGYELFPATRDQFNAYISSESARFAEIIKKAQISLD
jgi:tripartite-type tricarboxylate transporter receptor subunit TctC